MANCQGGSDSTMEIDMLARVLAHISLAAMAFTPHAGPKDDIGTSQHCPRKNTEQLKPLDF